MNTKHTPGPWVVVDNTLQGDGHQLRVDSETHGCIADCGTAPFVDATSKANAALISAAPELLEAAKYALDCATNKRDGRTLEEMAIKVRQLLTDAIAKAEGRS